MTAATNSKPYDLTTSAAAIPTITAGTLADGDTVSWTETYDNVNIGVNKVLTPAGTVTDNNGGANYFVTFVKNNTGVITKRPATVSVGNLTQAYTGAPLTPNATTTPAGLAVVWSGAAQIAAGSYQVTATIDDPTYEGSQSGTFTVTTLDTTVAVASEINPVFTGSPVTFIATVSPRSAATGIVTFKDNGEIIGAGPVSGSPPSLLPAPSAPAATLSPWSTAVITITTAPPRRIRSPSWRCPLPWLPRRRWAASPPPGRCSAARSTPTATL